MKKQKQAAPVLNETITEQSAEPLKRAYVQAPVATDFGLPCSHCGARYNHRTANVYPTGIRRMICSACHKPFPARRLQAPAAG